MKNSKFKTQNLKLVLLLVVYVVLAAIYSFVTPLGEGPDEPGHAAFVFFLARENRLPDQRVNEVPGEGHQPPLAYLLATPAAFWLPQAERTIDLAGNPRFVWAGGDQVNAAAHGTRELWPWLGPVLAWHLMRLVSVACGAVTVAMTWAAANHLRFTILDLRLSEARKPSSNSSIVNRKSEIVKFPLLAAALVAFNPQFLFISGLASNDALLAALSATTLWLCVRGPTPPVLLGLVLGLALLTKTSALVLVPMLLLAVVLQHWNGAQRLQSIRRAMPSMLGLLVVAALVCGWWYLRNWRLYGDLLGLDMFQGEFVTQAFDFVSLAAWSAALGQLHDSFWARFGWMNVAPPGWVLLAFVGIEVGAITGWLTLIRHRGGRGVIGRRWVLLIMLIGATYAFLLVFARTAGLVAWQGRLLFPAISAIAILFAHGLCHLGQMFRNGQQTTRNGQRASITFCVLLFALAAWLPFGVIRPAYPVEVLSGQAALRWQGVPVYGRFGLIGDPGAELRAFTATGERKPGAALDVRLLWHALGRQNRNWTVFIHLVDADGQIVVESNREPRAGAYPFGVWVEGDWIEDSHVLAMPSDLAPGRYTLRMGLFDQRGTQERTGVWNAAGELVGDYLELEMIDITAGN